MKGLGTEKLDWATSVFAFTLISVYAILLETLANVFSSCCKYIGRDHTAGNTNFINSQFCKSCFAYSCGDSFDCGEERVEKQCQTACGSFDASLLVEYEPREGHRVHIDVT